MYQFYVDPNQIEPSRAVITGADVNHIRNVLRMKPGEVVRVADGAGACYEGEISEIDSDQVVVALSGEKMESTELPSVQHLLTRAASCTSQANYIKKQKYRPGYARSVFVFFV